MLDYYRALYFKDGFKKPKAKKEEEKSIFRFSYPADLKGPNAKYNLHYGRGDFLRPPHGTASPYHIESGHVCVPFGIHVLKKPLFT